MVHVILLDDNDLQYHSGSFYTYIYVYIFLSFLLEYLLPNEIYNSSNGRLKKPQDLSSLVWFFNSGFENSFKKIK